MALTAQTGLQCGAIIHFALSRYQLTTPLWPHHYDVTIMTSPLWRHHYDVTIMTSPLWRHHHVIYILQIFFSQDSNYLLSIWIIFKEIFIRIIHPVVQPYRAILLTIYSTFLKLKGLKILILFFLKIHPVIFVIHFYRTSNG